jgi:quercetin dioxygenase-like cupin family protein
MREDLHRDASWLVNAIGNALRRGHGEETGVGETLARLAEQDLSIAALLEPEPRRLPACRHLAELTAHAMMIDAGVAAAVASCEDALHWVQNPNYAHDSAMADYAYCEIVGPRGFFTGEDFLLGLMIIGPERIYRDHLHKAPELYWLLTGPTDWSHAYGPYQAYEAGDTLWHPANLVHATRTLHAPLLAVWAWTRDVAEPARYAER